MHDAIHTVFFSYSRSDADFVLKVAKALRKEGRHIWVDQLDIPKGGRWDEEVEKALKASSCLLVALSPASSQSQNVLDEVSYALDEKKVVIPILLQSGNIPFRLKRLQYIDFTGDFDDAYRQLITALDTLSSPQAVAKADKPAQLAVDSPPNPAIGVRHDEPESGKPEDASTRIERGISAQRHFPKKIIPAVIVLCVVAIGYALFANMKSRQEELEASIRSKQAGAVDSVEALVAANRQPPVTAASPADAGKGATETHSAPITDAQAKDFVGRYLAAQNSANASQLLRFYADRVDYFNQQSANKDFILKDKQNYYRRWPEVDNRLVSAIDVQQTPGDGTVQVSYTIQYRVTNPARAESKSGVARDELQLRLTNGDLSIVAQRQKVLSTVN